MNSKFRILRLAELVLITGLFLGILVFLPSRAKAEYYVTSSTLNSQVITHTWQVEYVDDAKGQFDNVQDGSLQLDGAGHPHLVYGGLHLYYAVYDGSNWNIEKVDGTSGVGVDAVLALESTAPYTPHIAYRSNAGMLRYATKRNGQWHKQVIDSETRGNSTSMAVDTNGYPHVAYSRGDTLMYAHWNGNSWQCELVENVNPIAKNLFAPTTPTGGGWGGLYPSIDLDSSNIPHIGYMSIAAGVSVRHAHLTEVGTWAFETIEENIGYPDDLSMALDAADNPHFFYSGYFGVNDGELHYAYSTGTTWITQTITSTRSSDISLDITPSDEPRIAYKGSGSSTMRYGVLTGQTWSIQTVRESLIGYPSLSFDESGIPHIGYYCPRQWGISDSSVRYTTWSGSEWIEQVVDTETSYVGNYTSFALDASGNPHLSYLYQANPYVELRYAHQMGSAWMTQTVASDDGNNLAYTSLAIDTLGYPHIGYVTGDFTYARWNGSDWSFQVVDNPPAGHSAYWRYPSLVLDNDDNPHFSYYDAYGNGALRYAYWNSTEWVTQTVETDLGGTSSWDAGESSLQLDNLGIPHISYYDAVREDLKYTYWDGSGWITQVVDSTGDVGKHNSLILDTNGRPHISYRFDLGGWPDYGVRYAHWNGSAWITQTVALGGNTNATSISFDSSGRPCITYNDVMYACLINGEWQVSTIEIAGGNHKTLQMDGLGYPHIGYYDNWNPALKYAHLAQSKAIASPTSDTTLAYTDSQGLSTTLWVPAGSVTETTTLVYLAASDIGSIPENLVSVNRAFEIKAFRGDQAIPHFNFSMPVTLTIQYSADDVAELDTSTLTLRYWDGQVWSDDGINLVEHNTTNNYITFSISHLTEFALLGEKKLQATPSITKSVSPGGQVQYGDELTYTLVISGAPGAEVSIYDPLTSTMFLRFLEQPDGIEYASHAITGTMIITPTNQMTVSFFVQVGVPGTVGIYVDVSNTACIYPAGQTISMCEWSNTVTNQAYRPHTIFLPLVMRSQ